MYLDAINQPVDIGDYVAYGSSGYQRIAKILDIQCTSSAQRTHYTVPTQITHHKLTIMTATNHAIKRTHCFNVWNSGTDVNIWSILKLDKPPAEQEEIIEKRLAKDK